MHTKDQLQSLRSEINDINKKILCLLNHRAEIALKVAKCKAQLGISGFDPVRESEMLAELFEENEGPFSNEELREIFKNIFQKTLLLMDRQDRKEKLLSRKLIEKVSFTVNGTEISSKGEEMIVVAGPCAVESREQLEGIASFLQAHGLKFMRGGAFKPRTSPYDFQGLGLEGLKMLCEVAHKYDLNVVSEITDPRLVKDCWPYVDVWQIGARNMYNYALLREVGSQDKPVILKRNFAATWEELILAAEYILQAGNEKIILCERGLRTSERWVRNTLDLSSVPILHQETPWPVMVDISHAAGRRDILPSLALASKAVGADLLMVEVHNCPERARSDSQQQLSLEEFEEMLKAIF